MKQYGNASFDPAIVADMSKEEFVKKFAGKVVCKTHNLEEIYNELAGTKPAAGHDPREGNKVDGPKESKRKKAAAKEIKPAEELPSNTEEQPS